MENTTTLRRIETNDNEPTRDELIGALVGHYETVTNKIIDLEYQIRDLKNDLCNYIQWREELRQEALQLDFDLDR